MSGCWKQTEKRFFPLTLTLSLREREFTCLNIGGFVEDLFGEMAWNDINAKTR